MKFKLMFTSLVAAAFLAGYAHQGHAGGGHDHGSMMDHDPMMDEKGSMTGHEEMTDHKTGEEGTKAVEVGNKICPVSGERIDSGKMGEAVKYEYNGKMYNLCCDMCIKDFKKDPEKYSKIAEEEARRSKEHKEGDGHEGYVLKYL